MARPSPVKGSAITVTSLSDWSFGVDARHERRQLTGGGELVQMTAMHYLANLGYAPVDWLQLVASAGAARPDLDEEEGEFGLSLGLGLRASLLEFALDQSPELGRKQAVRLETDVFYRSADSHLGPEDFEWQELFVAPLIVYERLSRAATDWLPYEPAGATLRAGPVYSGLQADLATTGYAENRNFGLLLGTDLLMPGDVVFSGTLYGMSSDDLTFELGLNYFF